MHSKEKLKGAFIMKLVKAIILVACSLFMMPLRPSVLTGVEVYAVIAELAKEEFFEKGNAKEVSELISRETDNIANMPCKDFESFVPLYFKKIPLPSPFGMPYMKEVIVHTPEEVISGLRYFDTYAKSRAARSGWNWGKLFIHVLSLKRNLELRSVLRNHQEALRAKTAKCIRNS
jgi:hypothetical protein